MWAIPAGFDTMGLFIMGSWDSFGSTKIHPAVRKGPETQRKPPKNHTQKYSDTQMGTRFSREATKGLVLRADCRDVESGLELLRMENPSQTMQSNRAKATADPQNPNGENTQGNKTTQSHRNTETCRKTDTDIQTDTQRLKDSHSNTQRCHTHPKNTPHTPKTLPTPQKHSTLTHTTHRFP